MILRQWSLICCRRRARGACPPTRSQPRPCHSVQPPPPASVAAKPPSAGKMMKLFDAPRLLFAFALVVFFAFFPISRWSAVPPPLGLPRLPRDPDANAPLESRAVAIVARAVAIVARLRTVGTPSEIRTRVSDKGIRERSLNRNSESLESLVLHFMDVDCLRQPRRFRRAQHSLKRTVRAVTRRPLRVVKGEGFANVAPDLRSRPRSRPPVAAGSEFDRRLRKYLTALFSDGSDGVRLDSGFHAVRTRCLFPRVPSEPSRFVWPHERAETRVGGDIRGGRSEARRDAFGEPRRAKRRFH